MSENTDKDTNVSAIGQHWPIIPVNGYFNQTLVCMKNLCKVHRPPASSYSPFKERNSSFHYAIRLQLSPSPLLSISSPSLGSVLFWLSMIASNAFLPLSITRAVILSHSCTAAGQARACTSNRWLHVIFYQQEMQREARTSHTFTRGQVVYEGLCTHFTLSSWTLSLQIHGLPIKYKSKTVLQACACLERSFNSVGCLKRCGVTCNSALQGLDIK